MSVTSSGRSSISSTISFTSGLLSEIAFAIFFSSVVLPAFGCETIMPRCPLPIGATTSIIRSDISGFFGFSILSRSFGYHGTSDSNGLRCSAFSGDSPFTRLIYTSAL